MKNLLKIGISFSLVFMFMASGIAVVRADGQWFNSTISISTHSSLIGKERQYSYDYYRTDITPNNLETGSANPSVMKLNMRLIRPLYRLGIHYGDETKYDSDISFSPSAVGVTRSVYLGNCGDGKRYFAFSTAEGYAGTGSISGQFDIYNYS